MRGMCEFGDITAVKPDYILKSPQVVAQKEKIKLVIVESPYSGDVEDNIRYARACIADCLRRGEAPFASHLLYTQDGVLRDDVASEREWGMQAGWEWMVVADLVAVYCDRGISFGMEQGVARALKLGKVIEYRYLLLRNENAY